MNSGSYGMLDRMIESRTELLSPKNEYLTANYGNSTTNDGGHAGFELLKASA